MMRTVLHRARFWLDHRWAPAHMSDYLDAELSSPRGLRLERHVGECEACRRLLGGLRAMLGVLHSLGTTSGEVDVARMVASVRVRLGEPQDQR